MTTEETDATQTDETDDAPRRHERLPDDHPAATALRRANHEAERLRLQLKEFEDRDKSEVTKATERATAADERAATAELNYLKFKVAAEKGIPAKQAHRLQGADEKSLADDADTLLEELGTRKQPDFDGGARRSAPANDMNALIANARGRR